jgi:hypothetical protein
VVAGALDGAQLVARGLLGFELANVCLTKCRRHPDLREAFLPRSNCVGGWESRKLQSITETSLSLPRVQPGSMSRCVPRRS